MKPNLTRGERFKDARTVHNKNGNQTMDEVHNATGVSSSLIKDLEDDEKNRSVGYDKIVQLAKHYGVSIDWLLGLSDVRSPSTVVRGIVEYTGLSENSIHFLHNAKEYGLGDDAMPVIDKLLFDYRYHNQDHNSGRSYRPILNLINYFLCYRNSGMRKKVYANGTITNHQTKYTPSNAIELNDVVIENAVLAEIQQALASLKRNLAELEE